MKRLLIGVSVFVLTLSAAGVTSAQSDPRIGTWTLNVAKSKQTATPSRKSETRTYESSGDNVTMHSEVTIAMAANKFTESPEKQMARITLIQASNPAEQRP